MAFAYIKELSLNAKILIEILIAQIKNLQHTVEQLGAENPSLKSRLDSYKNKKNSSNSHTLPSKDKNRPGKIKAFGKKRIKNRAASQAMKASILNVAESLMK